MKLKNWFDWPERKVLDLKRFMLLLGGLAGRNYTGNSCGVSCRSYFSWKVFFKIPTFRFPSF